MGVFIKTYAAETHKRPAGSRPLSILMIGDLHGKQYGRQNRELLEAIRRMRPDFAVTVGDMMLAVPDFDITDLLTFYEELRGICPVFAVNGNHETKMKLHTVTFGTIYKEYDHELQRMGGHVMNNSGISAVIDGMPLRVCGEVGTIIAAKVVEVIGTKIDIPRWRTAKEEIRALIAANTPA